MDQATLKELIAQVIRDVVTEAAAPAAAAAQPKAGGVATMSPTSVGDLRIAEAGEAQRGTDPKEVVVALSPGFSTAI